MPNHKTTVIAAIPNYNMAASLERLLPQVLEQGYDAVFVLDDASTDNSQQVASRFNGRVHFIAGDKNVGAGGNRNRIIAALKELDMTGIIHFIDADMHLETKHIPDLARRLVSSDSIGFIACLITDTTGRQHPWNFGPRMSLWSFITASTQAFVCMIGTMSPAIGRKLHSLFRGLLVDWPDVFSKPMQRQIFWGTEGNLLIRSEVFAEVGGFDPNLRDHEINELAMRIAARGLKNFFDPSIVVTHEAVNVRGGSRGLQMARNERQIIRKIGFRNWLLPDGKLRPTLR